MARRLVKISLATKFRLVFGLAVLGVIVAALAVPWYFMELLAEQGVQRPGLELTRLRFHEWVRDHRKDPTSAEDRNSDIVALYATGAADTRSGPSFIALVPGAKHTRPLDSTALRARTTFQRNSEQKLAILRDENDRGEAVYRGFRAVRVDPSCMSCHGNTAPRPELRYQPGQLAGMIELTLPTETASTPLVWWTRGAFLVGAVLAASLAFVLFTVIAQRLILRPMRDLRDLADKVAEGDLTVRSTIRTGDELQRLGESFNEMLEAIRIQHDKLRAANRALDLKLSELAEANVTLFRANKVKSEFLANVSHELRTPLNSIIGFADLLAEREDERIRRYGQNISQAAKNLLSMINDLLDMAKIEAGRADVRFDKVSVLDTCRTLLQLMGPLADKKQITLRDALDEQLPLVTTDAGKLQQILYNLLSNAIKFTPAGGQVTLAAERLDGGEADEIAVHVSDTGPGIAEADQTHIFEKFYQADATLTKESYGTGLGLAISKELTNLLGGRLTLKSKPGHGARFTVVLPIDRAEPDDGGETEATRNEK